MPELLWFLLGGALTAVALLIRSGRRARRTAADSSIAVSESVAVSDDPAGAEPVVVETAASGEAELEQVCGRLSRELADLATDIDGHAQLLCEALGEPENIAQRAERLWAAVRRLRFFSEKVLCAARGGAIHASATDIRELLGTLRAELDDYSRGTLQVQCVAARAMPHALAEREALRKALLFLAEGLLAQEPAASTLSIRASTHFDDEEGASVEIDVQVEADTDSSDARAAPSDTGSLARVAAQNLLRGMSAEFDFERIPGLRCTARIRLAAVERETSPAVEHVPPAPVREARPHPFGGVLLLDDEPGIRSVVQAELGRMGRRVVCCGEGAAARTLFHATPERFEMLIVEAEARGGSAPHLAADAMAASPDLKVLVLTTGSQPLDALRGVAEHRWATMRKPFGVNELRHTLGEMLLAHAAPDSGAAP